jgi:hypothetical protein
MDENKLVSGLVIGMRKSGTTWLYENFKKSRLVAVSNKVKESGFFTFKNNISINEYHQLFDNNCKLKIEVDTSIIYDSDAAKRIFIYNPKMKILAIKRDPMEYIVSRYIHAKRKGLINEECVYDAIIAHDWLKNEIMFFKNINTFKEFFPSKSICILDFSLLKSNPEKFIDLSFRHLTSLNPDFNPDFNVINPAKISSLPLLTVLISFSARFFRRLGLYSFVNFFKKFGLHLKIEKNPDPIQLTKKEVDLIVKITDEDEKRYGGLYD